MQYTPKAFFRLVPKNLLRRYFAERDELTDFSWDDVEDGGDVTPLFEAWHELEPRSRAETESTFRAVWDLSTTQGGVVLAEEGRFHGHDFAGEFEAREGHQHRAFWVMLEHPRVFHVATNLNHADRLHRRYWRTRNDLPKREPDDSEPSLRALGTALSAYYAQEGRGADCDVECYLRAGRKHYYFAYPADYASTFTGYVGSRLVRRAQQPAFEVVFVYDPVEGTLDLHAHGGKKVATQLQTIFSRVILGEDLGPEDRVVTPFELNGLKDRNFPFPTDPEDGIEEVRVKALRLSVMGRHDRGRLTFEVDARRGTKALYDLLEKSLNQQRVPLSNVNVTLATIQMVLTRPDNKTKTLTFNVSFPESCNLPRDNPEGMKAREYLRRWGIARA